MVASTCHTTTFSRACSSTVVSLPSGVPDLVPDIFIISGRELGMEYSFRARSQQQGRELWSDELAVASVTSLYPKTPSGVTLVPVEAREFTIG